MNDNSCAHLRVFRWILAGLGLAVLALYFLERAAKLSCNAVWLLAAAVLAIAFSALYRWVLRPMQSCRNDRLEREYAADILNKQAELDALQSQINPHFLYNTLDSIRGQALSEGAEDIADMAERFREREGHYPSRILADKIYRNRENLRFCKERGIRLSGPALGRPKKEEVRNRTQDFLDECERVEVERRFSLAKRKCGLGLIMSKLRQTIAHSVAMYSFSF